jgi:hypothetical protein
LGDTDSRPKVELFVVPKYVELATSGADLFLILVAIAGGNQPAVTPAVFLVHLSSKFLVSEGVWLRSPSAACVRQQDGHSSSSFERAGLEAQRT